MTTPNFLLSLRDFGTFLALQPPDFPASAIKAIPFRGVNPKTGERAVLHAETPRDLASALAMALGLAYLDKKKDVLKPLQSENLPANELKARLTELDEAWLVQVTVRKSDGSPALDSENNIRTQLSAPKLGALLAAGRVGELLIGRDLGNPADIKAIAEALPSRATHLVKLSVDSGSARAEVRGGYFKSAPVLVPEVGHGSVSEEDFLTENTVALTCNAGFQVKDWLAFTSVQFGQRRGCLVDMLVADVALREEVATVLEADFQVQGIRAFMDSLDALRSGEFSGEPQLFCMDANRTAAVAPLMPLALPLELLRANAALRALREEGLVAEKAAAESAEAAATEALAQLKGVGAKSYPEGKAAYTEALKAAKDHLAEAKVATKRAGKNFLFIPTYTLMLGGSSPQNIGSGLTSAIHKSPILTRIRERVKRADIGNKAFHPRHLLATPRIQLARLPVYLEPTATTAPQRQQRKALFSGLALESLAPLMELREAWELEDAPTIQALYAEVLPQIEVLPDGKNLFVKGAPGLTGKKAVEAFAPLISDVSARIKDSLRGAFPKASLSHLDGEVRAAAQAVVLMERA